MAVPNVMLLGPWCVQWLSKYQLPFPAPIQCSANAYEKQKEGKANKDTAPHGACESEKNISARGVELKAKGTDKERRQTEKNLSRKEDVTERTGARCTQRLSPLVVRDRARLLTWCCLALVHRTRVATPNDRKLSDSR